MATVGLRSESQADDFIPDDAALKGARVAELDAVPVPSAAVALAGPVHQLIIRKRVRVSSLSSSVDDPGFLGSPRVPATVPRLH